MILDRPVSCVRADLGLEFYLDFCSGIVFKYLLVISKRLKTKGFNLNLGWMIQMSRCDG